MSINLVLWLKEEIPLHDHCDKISWLSAGPEQGRIVCWHFNTLRMELIMKCFALFLMSTFDSKLLSPICLSSFWNIISWWCWVMLCCFTQITHSLENDMDNNLLVFIQHDYFTFMLAVRLVFTVHFGTCSSDFLSIYQHLSVDGWNEHWFSSKQIVINLREKSTYMSQEVLSK